MKRINFLSMTLLLSMATSVLVSCGDDDEPQTFTPTPIESICPDSKHPHIVDLGLPSGTIWTCCNLGASSPEGNGNYYAWGETTTKTYYGPSTYMFAKVNDEGILDPATGKKYSYDIIGHEIAGTTFDVVTANKGKSWSVPTLVQFQELFDNTNSEWVTKNGVQGRRFTSMITGKSIFLPAGGCRWHDEVASEDGIGYYWTSSLLVPYPNNAYTFGFSSDKAYIHYYSRDFGQPVRPVCNVLEVYETNVEIDGLYYNFHGKEAGMSYAGGTGKNKYTYKGDITIPSSVTYFGKSFPVTSIDDLAFADSKDMTSISIPSSVTKFNGSSNFWNCYALRSIYCYGANAPKCTQTNTFGCYSEGGLADTPDDIYNYCILHVPNGRKEEYASASVWRKFKNIKDDL